MPWLWVIFVLDIKLAIDHTFTFQRVLTSPEGSDEQQYPSHPLIIMNHRQPAGVPPSLALASLLLDPGTNPHRLGQSSHELMIADQQSPTNHCLTYLSHHDLTLEEKTIKSCWHMILIKYCLLCHIMCHFHNWDLLIADLMSNKVSNLNTQWWKLNLDSKQERKMHVRGVIISTSTNRPWRSRSRIILNKVISTPWYIIGANLEALICPEFIVQTRVCKGCACW